MSDLREHLLATIAYISTKRAKLIVELDETESLMKSLQREVEALPTPYRLAFPETKKDGPFAEISIRWSVFLYLTEFAHGPETIGSIAEALRMGGAGERSKAQSFNANVSAVLSQMTGKGELEKISDRFALTDHGRVVWQAIRNGNKFANLVAEEENAEPHDA